MKNILNFTILSICLFLCSCGSSSNTTNKQERVFDSLVEYLRSVPGVRVNGSGNKARVQITRGMHNATLRGATPLFVLEGQKIGNTLIGAMQVIDHNEIKRVRVLNSGEATIRFGINGSNGAIEFFMKK